MPGQVHRPQEHLIWEDRLSEGLPSILKYFSTGWKRCFLQRDLLREPASILRKVLKNVPAILSAQFPYIRITALKSGVDYSVHLR